MRTLRRTTTIKALPRLARDGIWVVSGKLAIGTAGLVGVRVLTGLAPTHIYGGVSLLLGLLALGHSVFLGPIVNGQLRFDPEYSQRGQLRWFNREIRFYAWAATGSFVLVGSAGYASWSVIARAQFKPILVAIMILLACVSTFKSLGVSRLNAARAQALAFRWLGTEAWLLVLFPAAALMIRPSQNLYLGGVLIGTIAALLLFGRGHVATSPGNEAGAGERAVLRRDLFRYGIPFVPLALVLWVHNIGDRYLLAGYLGTGAVGRYAATYAIASQPFLLVSGAGATLFRPVLFEARTRGDFARARHVIHMWLLCVGGIGLLGVILFATLGPLVARVLLATSYQPGAPHLMVWIASGYALVAINQCLEIGLMAELESRKLLVPATFAATANVALNLLLIPSIGIQGAAVATAAAFGLQSLLLGRLAYHSLERLNARVEGLSRNHR